MNKRTIHVTEGDMHRLRELIMFARGRDGRDQPYLAALESELDRAVVLAREQIAPDVVTMNSRARLRDGVRTWTITLVFPDLADAESGSISVLAPLGAAILGCRVGQTVDFSVPGGESRSCEILGVLYQPEAAGDRHL
ncbi:MAG TPA: nucleoside diphosphate kinase regulator [Phycisphaerales bacterium]|nr:nucleoside diphosphate kinase regulator [Phycisphaerales bacterium]